MTWFVRFCSDIFSKFCVVPKSIFIQSYERVNKTKGKSDTGCDLDSLCRKMLLPLKRKEYGNVWRVISLYYNK
jgi:hypothetical protein